MTDTEFFLNQFSAIYPYSHCVWRIGEAAALVKYLPFRGTCLDLGCGDGSYMKIMLERVGKPRHEDGTPGMMIGLDPQAKEISKAGKLGIYDRLHVGYSTKLPAEDASLDMVFSNSVVEHIEDKHGTIEEVARALKFGGKYLFSAPSENFTPGLSFGKSLGAWLNRTWSGAINRKFKHYWLQSPQAWKEDLAQHGLTLKAWRYTLTPENLAVWEKYLIPSYLQHIPAKRLGWVPGSGLSRKALCSGKVCLLEPEDLAVGGNLILCAEKSRL
jgi:ubiquinone/menaquinone biosynthesis C-methylase UbiE